MKKLLICVCLLVVALTQAVAQEKKAVIEFDKTTHDFGTFSEVDPIVTCKFVFMNSGDAPLVIHQAVASCGCTVPNYPKEPILPGGTGDLSSLPYLLFAFANAQFEQCSGADIRQAEY